MFKNNFKKDKSGFTIVESMVAIGVLTISILAAFGAVQSSLQNSIGVKDQITAHFLAQEGMEFIRNIRDANTLAYQTDGTTHWLHNMSELAGDICYFGKSCTMDSTTASFVSCPSAGACPNLRREAATGLVGYNAGWTLTNFNREIQLTSITADQILVTVTMRWTTRGIAKTFQASELLFSH